MAIALGNNEPLPQGINETETEDKVAMKYICNNDLPLSKGGCRDAGQPQNSPPSLQSLSCAGYVGYSCNTWFVIWVCRYLKLMKIKAFVKP